MCGFSNTERGYRSLVDEYVSTAKRHDNAYGIALMAPARMYLRLAQEKGWLRDYDPVTCERKKPDTPRKAPVYREGMKVVRKAIKEAEKVPPELERTPNREKARA